MSFESTRVWFLACVGALAWASACGSDENAPSSADNRRDAGQNDAAQSFGGTRAVLDASAGGLDGAGIRDASGVSHDAGAGGFVIGVGGSAGEPIASDASPCHSGSECAACETLGYSECQCAACGADIVACNATPASAQNGGTVGCLDYVRGCMTPLGCTGQPPIFFPGHGGSWGDTLNCLTDAVCPPANGKYALRVAALAPDLAPFNVCVRVHGAASYGTPINQQQTNVSAQSVPPDGGAPPPPPPQKCGDGIREGSESCDGKDLGPATCASLTLGLNPNGIVRCTAGCTYDPSGCSSASGTGGSTGAGAAPGAGGGFSQTPYCGDGIRQPGEECEPAPYYSNYPPDLGGATCASATHGTAPTGTLGCTTSCKLDTSGCCAPYVSPPLPPTPTALDGVDYREVTAYAPVAGADLDVKLVSASANCAAPAVLEKRVSLETARTTLLVSGSPSTLRVLPLSDPDPYVATGYRLVQTVEGAPPLLVGSDFWDVNYPKGIADRGPGNSVDSRGYGPFPLTIQGPYGGGPQVGPFTAEDENGNFVGAWTVALDGYFPSFARLAYTGFIHGEDISSLGVLECDDYGAPANGLSHCTELPPSCVPSPQGPSTDVPIFHASPDTGPVDVCRKWSGDTPWTDSDKVVTALPFGSFAVSSGTQPSPVFKVVPNGASCSSPALGGEVGNPPNGVVLLGLSAPEIDEPPLRLNGIPYSGGQFQLLSALVGLDVSDFGAVTNGVLSQVLVRGVAFDNASGQNVPNGTMTLGLAPIGTTTPSYVATQSVMLNTNSDAGSYFPAYFVILEGRLGTRAVSPTLLLCGTPQGNPFPVVTEMTCDSIPLAAP